MIVLDSYDVTPESVMIEWFFRDGARNNTPFVRNVAQRNIMFKGNVIKMAILTGCWSLLSRCLSCNSITSPFLLFVIHLPLQCVELAI